MTKQVAVIGASGFVGTAIAAALEARGATVARHSAPRLRTAARHLEALGDVLQRRNDDGLSDVLANADVVINAAGVAGATDDGDELFGADALLPGVVAQATPIAARLIHISSAAVQGRREPLDESLEVAPFSPYSHAKALGEELLRSTRNDATAYRPTSVHGVGRPLTRALCRVLSSPAASVAGRDERPTPQALVENVGDAIAFLAELDGAPPPVVLHPWEGLTTESLVRVVGNREPLHLPVPLARSLLASAAAAGRLRPSILGIARRLEMMWFGQAQQPGWLDDRWEPPLPRSAWTELK